MNRAKSSLARHHDHWKPERLSPEFCFLLLLLLLLLLRTTTTTTTKMKHALCWLVKIENSGRVKSTYGNEPTQLFLFLETFQNVPNWILKAIKTKPMQLRHWMTSPTGIKQQAATITWNRVDFCPQQQQQQQQQRRRTSKRKRKKPKRKKTGNSWEHNGSRRSRWNCQVNSNQVNSPL